MKYDELETKTEIITMAVEHNNPSKGSSRATVGDSGVMDQWQPALSFFHSSLLAISGELYNMHIAHYIDKGKSQSTYRSDILDRSKS